MKTLIKRLIPKPLFNLFSYQREIHRLRTVPAGTVSFENLGRVTDSRLRECFSRSEFDSEWLELTAHLKRFGLWNVPRTTGSGDLRPLYYLARCFGWRSVLEIGIHVGGSTITLAYAMSRCARDTGQTPGRITTIDILDVNDRQSGPWRDIGMPNPPARSGARNRI